MKRQTSSDAHARGLAGGMKLLWLYTFVSFTVACAVGVSNAAWPYKIAGPIPGAAKIEQAPQTDVGQAEAYRTFFLEALVMVAYCGFGPAAFWLTGTARTTLMRAWYSGCTLSFACFGLVMRLLFSFGWASVISILASLALAADCLYLGFRHTTLGFILSQFWSSFLLVNLLHVLAGATEETHYMGLGANWWLLAPATVALLIVLVAFDGKYSGTFENVICAFTSAYTVVAGLSYVLFYISQGSYFLRSPFDVVSFFSLPIQFRWSSPTSLILLGCWLLMAAFGFFFSARREFLDGPSPGFTSGTGGIGQTVMRCLFGDGFKALNITEPGTSKLPLLSFGSGTGSESRTASHSAAVDNKSELLETVCYKPLFKNAFGELKTCATPADFEEVDHCSYYSPSGSGSDLSPCSFPSDPSPLINDTCTAKHFRTAFI